MACNRPVHLSGPQHVRRGDQSVTAARSGSSPLRGRISVRVCVRACVRACVRSFVQACIRACLADLFCFLCLCLWLWCGTILVSWPVHPLTRWVVPVPVPVHFIVHHVCTIITIIIVIIIIIVVIGYQVRRPVQRRQLPRKREADVSQRHVRVRGRLGPRSSPGFWHSDICQRSTLRRWVGEWPLPMEFVSQLVVESGGVVSSCTPGGVACVHAHAHTDVLC